jgi:hypothetical protein
VARRVKVNPKAKMQNRQEEKEMKRLQEWPNQNLKRKTPL